jgi:hypothetical protein
MVTSWTKKEILGINTLQGRPLARLFAHLLLFSDVGIDNASINGEKNIVADYPPRLHFCNDLSPFLLTNPGQSIPRP